MPAARRAHGAMVRHRRPGCAICMLTVSGRRPPVADLQPQLPVRPVVSPWSAACCRCRGSRSATAAPSGRSAACPSRCRAPASSRCSGATAPASRPCCGRCPATSRGSAAPIDAGTISFDGQRLNGRSPAADRRRRRGAGPRGPPGLHPPDRRREPPHRRVQPPGPGRQGARPGRACTSCSRCCTTGGTSGPGCSPAGSSRCWPSAGR